MNIKTLAFWSNLIFVQDLLYIKILVWFFSWRQYFATVALLLLTKLYIINWRSTCCLNVLLPGWIVQIKSGNNCASEARRWMETEGGRVKEKRESKKIKSWLHIAESVYLLLLNYYVSLNNVHNEHFWRNEIKVCFCNIDGYIDNRSQI